MTSGVIRYPCRMYAIRGATQVSEDSKAAIHEGVIELLTEVMRANQIEASDVISVLFTATPDLVSDFPAAAARTIGFGSVPLICAAEISVPGALPRAIRAMLHVHGRSSDVHHIYLHGAAALRQDLAQ